MGFLGVVGGDFWRIFGDVLDGFSYSFGGFLGGILGDFSGIFLDSIFLDSIFLDSIFFPYHTVVYFLYRSVGLLDQIENYLLSLFDHIWGFRRFPAGYAHSF